MILNGLGDQKDVFRSPFFTLGLVRDLGKYYYHYIYILEKFFKRVKPQTVHYNPSESFISQLITAYVSKLGIEYKRIL